MNSYEVTLSVLTNMTYAVEARDEEEAYQLACVQANQYGDEVQEHLSYSVEQTSFN